MSQVGLLTIEQKNSLIGQEVQKDHYFNPIQDNQNRWVISIQEINTCNISWVKNLPLVEYEPKPQPPFPLTQ